MGQRVPVRRYLNAWLALALATTAVVPAAASPADVAVVVGAGSADRAAAAVHAAGGSVTAELHYLGAVAADVPDGALPALERRADLQVAADAPVEVASADAPAASTAAAASSVHLDALSLPVHWTPESGAGVGVALLDTGVADVPELDVVRGPDLSGDGDGLDHHGHGTFMAGLIAADGRVRGGDDPRFGVAPGAHVVSVKLAGRDGRTSVSKVLEGIGWVIANADTHGIRVLNLSLGATTNRAPQADPLVAAVEAAWAAGITVVVPSGNGGAATVTSPGRSPWVLTVGATDTVGTATTADDEVADWSGRSRVAGTLRPDVVAPGVSVTSLRAPGSAADDDNPAARVGDHHFLGSGTSMSAALVSGAVAVLAEHRHLATPDDLKGALTASAAPVSGSTAGAVDLAAADDATADPAWRQRHRGRVMPWAHADAPPQSITWERVRWLDDGWERVRWLDGRWERVRWLDDDWSRVRWLDDAWERVRWLETDWSRVRWLDTRWERVRWLDANWARVRWLDANWARVRWLDTDWSRVRWLSYGDAVTDPVDAPTTWGAARDRRGRP